MARHVPRHFRFQGLNFASGVPPRLTFTAQGFRCRVCPAARPPLLPVTVVRQFLDVVHHAVELPLRVHLLPSAQGEAIEPLVVPEVAEHRFDRREAPAVECSTQLGIDGALHPVGGALLRISFAPEEAHLPGLGHFWRPQAFLS
jgi:hypothetical protein